MNNAIRPQAWKPTHRCTYLVQQPDLDIVEASAACVSHLVMLHDVNERQRPVVWTYPEWATTKPDSMYRYGGDLGTLDRGHLFRIEGPFEGAASASAIVHVDAPAGLQPARLEPFVPPKVEFRNEPRRSGGPVMISPEPGGGSVLTLTAGDLDPFDTMQLATRLTMGAGLARIVFHTSLNPKHPEKPAPLARDLRELAALVRLVPWLPMCAADPWTEHVLNLAEGVETLPHALHAAEELLDEATSRRDVVVVSARGKPSARVVVENPPRGREPR